MARREDNQAAFNRAKSIIADYESGSIDFGDLVGYSVDLAKWVVALVKDKDAMECLLIFPPE